VYTRRARSPFVLHVTVVALVTLALAPPLSAQEAASDPVPRHDTLMLSSRVLGEARRINVHTPTSYSTADSARFPVISPRRAMISGIRPLGSRPRFEPPRRAGSSGGSSRVPT
jgi:hypothetical protein